MKFRFLAALHNDRRNAFQTIEARLHLIRRHLPQLGLRHGVGREAIADDGKSREGQAVRLNLRGRGKLGLHPGNRGVHVLQRLEHVHVPAEEQIDLGRSPAGNRAHSQQSGHAVDGLFNGPGDVTVIWSMGITPLSTAISTRGKSVEGKTDTGMVKARYAPNNPSVRMRKMTGRECRAIQYWASSGSATLSRVHAEAPQ